MAILYVVDDYDSVSQTFVRREIDALQERGASLSILSLHPSRPPDQEDHTHLQLPPRRALVRQALRGLSDPHIRHVLFDGVRRGSTLRSVAEQTYALGVALHLLQNESTYAHLHAHFFGRCADVAYYCHSLGGTTFSATGHASEVLDPPHPCLLARNARAAVCLVGESDLITRTLLAVGGNKPAITVRSGIPGSRIRLVGRPAPTGARVQLLTTARLVPKKGFPAIIDAAECLVQREIAFHWNIIGDGPMWGLLQEEVARRRLSAHISLLGARSNTEALQYLDFADIFVLPCVVQDDGESDGLPVALIEAVALGCPVITTAVAAIPELVADRQTGLIVCQHSGAEVAEAVNTLTTDPRLYTEISRKQTELAREHYVLETEVERLHSLLSVYA